MPDFAGLFSAFGILVSVFGGLALALEIGGRFCGPSWQRTRRFDILNRANHLLYEKDQDLWTLATPSRWVLLSSGPDPVNRVVDVLTDPSTGKIRLRQEVWPGVEKVRNGEKTWTWKSCRGQDWEGRDAEEAAQWLAAQGTSEVPQEAAQWLASQAQPT